MKRVSLFILLLVIACKGLYAQPRITGGFPINVTEAPWQVLLSINNQYACGGSIIAPNFILTAKHCVEGLSANSVKIIVGVTCKTEVNSNNTFNVSRIILHPLNFVAGERDSAATNYFNSALNLQQKIVNNTNFKT